MPPQLLDHALAYHMVGQTGKGLNAHDIRHAREQQFRHFTGQEPALTILIAQRQEGLRQIGNLLDGHGSFKAFGLFQRLECRTAQRTDTLHAQHRTGLACPSLAQRFVLEFSVVDGVVHEIHQIRHDCFCAFLFQQLHQMVVRHRHVFHQNFTHDAHTRLLHVLVDGQRVKRIHQLLAQVPIVTMAIHKIVNAAI